MEFDDNTFLFQAIILIEEQRKFKAFFMKLLKMPFY